MSITRIRLEGERYTHFAQGHVLAGSTGYRDGDGGRSVVQLDLEGGGFEAQLNPYPAAGFNLHIVAAGDSEMAVLAAALRKAADVLEAQGGVPSVHYQPGVEPIEQRITVS